MASLSTPLPLSDNVQQAGSREDDNRRPDNRYELAYDHRRALGLAVWALILTALILQAWSAPGGLPAAPLSLRIVSLFSALAAVVAWLWGPAWYNTRFRSFAWRTARLLRRTRALGSTLASLWFVAVAILILGAWAAWITYRFAQSLKLLDEKTLRLVQGFVAPAGELLASETLEAFALSLLVVAALHAVHQARRRIVILEFSNATGDKDLDGLCQGIAPRLRNELSSIAHLYRTIDEALPETRGRIFSPALSVANLGEPFGNTVGPDSALELKGFKIPFGLVSRWIGSLVGGPRLTGSLVREEGQLLLVAHLSGSRAHHSWRVGSSDLGSERDVSPSGKEVLCAMAEQLACRVATDLEEEVGSPRWEAVRHFNEGLRVYRKTRTTARDSGPELRHAEQEFIQALSEDQEFFRCHLNLGVVYQALGETASAEACLRRILESDPDRLEACYNLALVYFFNKNDFRNAAINAEKSLDGRPGHARSWNVRGVARDRQLRAGEGPTKHRLAPEAQRLATRDFAIATAMAWRRLCQTALFRESKTRSREQEASVCTTNLGIALAESGELRQSRRVFAQALILTPRDPWVHLELGRALFRAIGDREEADRRKLLRKAKVELYQAFGDGLRAPEDKAIRWLYLLSIHACLGETGRVPECLRNFQDFATPGEELVLAAGQEGAGQGQKLSQYQDRLRAITAALDEITEVGEIPRVGGVDYLDLARRLTGFLQELEDGKAVDPLAQAWPDSQKPWLQAQVLVWRARKRLYDDPGEARFFLERALRLLTESRPGHKRQIHRQGLRSVLAKALLLEARVKLDCHRVFAAHRDSAIALLLRAVTHAQESAVQQPESPARHWVLSDVYCALRDFPQAENEREMSFKLGSNAELLDDCAAMSSLAASFLNHAYDPASADPKARLRNGRKLFARVLQIIESRPFADKNPQPQAILHSAAHFWLGRFHYELGERSQAVTHLRIARSMGFRPVESRLWLGLACAEDGLFVKAEEAFREAMAVARTRLRLLRKTGQPAAPLPEPSRTEPERDVESTGLLHSLVVRLLLQHVLHLLGRSLRLPRAVRLTEFARRHIWLAPKASHRALWALYHECRGAIALYQGDVDNAIHSLHLAARFGPSAGVDVRLAEALLRKSTGQQSKEEKLRREAREAYERAKSADFANRYGKEIGALEKLLEKRDAEKPPTAPASKPAGAVGPYLLELLPSPAGDGSTATPTH